MPDSRTARQRALSGVKWVYLTHVLAKAVQPVTTVILARLLTPEDFGLVGMAVVVMGVLALVRDLGLESAFIQRQTDQTAAADVVFWAEVVLGIACYGLLWMIAPWVAGYFHEELVKPLLSIVGLSLLIQPFGTVQGLLLTKEFAFRALFRVTISSVLLSGAVSISLAYSGYGVWSLVYGGLAGSLLSTTIMWMTHSWRPRWRFDTKVARELFLFGKNTTLELVLAWAMSWIDNIFVGRFLGPAQLGIYRMGVNVAFLPTTQILGPLSQVTYPIYCQMGANRDELRRGYLKMTGLIALIAFPIGILLVIIAPDLIPVLLGPRWSPAVPVAQLLALQGTLSALLLVAPQIYKAMGRSEIMPKFYGVRMVFSIPAYYVAAQQGLVPLCITHIALALIFMPINMHIALKVLDLSWRTIYTSVKAGLHAGVLSGAVVGGTALILHEFQGVTGPVRLSMMIGLYMVLSVLFIRVVHESTYLEARALCHRLLK